MVHVYVIDRGMRGTRRAWQSIDQERQRKLKKDIEKQKEIATERQRAIEEKEGEIQRLERLARERRELEQRMCRREE